MKAAAGAAALAALAALAGAAAAAAPGGEVPGSAPTKLWYRIDATVDARYERHWDDTAEHPRPDTRHAHWRLRSRTAVVLSSQCASREPNGATPAAIGGSVGLPGAAPCERVLAQIRPRDRAHFRRLLVDDVSFAANAQGFLDEYEESMPGGSQTSRVADYRRDGRSTNATIWVHCPPAGLTYVRVPGQIRLGGTISAASLANGGVAIVPIDPVGGILAHRAEIYPGCPHPHTDKVLVLAKRNALTETRLERGRPFGGLLAPEPVPFRIHGHFGKTFEVERTIVRGHRFANATETATVVETVVFSVCPDGGRDVDTC
jgi:hypothetical protein